MGIQRSTTLGACLLVASAVPVSQTALAAEATWGISGWINEGMTYYDDGQGSNIAQLSDNGTTLGSRLNISGDYKPENVKLEAGFEVILELFSGVSNFAGGGHVTPLLFANQNNLETFNGGDIGMLGSSVYVGGDWGKFTLGLQSMPTDNIAVLADPSLTIWSGISPVFRGNGFFIRGAPAGTTWGQFVQCLTTPGLGIGIDCNGVYRNGVRYDLPAFGPVSVAVGYANDDIYDIALKYAGEVGGLKANLGVGYTINANGGTNVGGNGSELFQIQGGIMDPGTGLFGIVTYQLEEADNATPGTGDDTDAWYLKGGIRKAFNSLGDSAFYLEYGQYNDQYGSTAGVTGSEFTRYGGVIEQYIGSRLIIYGKLEQYELDVDGPSAALYNSSDDLLLATLGVTIFF